MDCNFKQEINHNELAMELAKKTEWSGVDILEICKLALTDVNFHPEAKVIHKMILKIENDPMNP